VGFSVVGLQFLLWYQVSENVTTRFSNNFQKPEPNDITFEEIFPEPD
jgi:hypothetical protein